MSEIDLTRAIALPACALARERVPCHWKGRRRRRSWRRSDEHLLVYQPVREVGFSFHLRWRDLWQALLGLLGFAVVGVPLGLGTGFLRFELSTPTLPGLATGVLGRYLLVALPEELPFRGLIQNLMIQRLGRAWCIISPAGSDHRQDHRAAHPPTGPASSCADL
jgi:membrane protease YdiL (CAAX protease family)